MAACGWDRNLLAVANLDISAILITFVFGIRTVTISFPIIIIVFSLPLILQRLAFLGGTRIPIRIHMTTLTHILITPIRLIPMTTEQVTIIGIGKRWPSQFNRNSPCAAIIMAQSTG